MVHRTVRAAVLALSALPLTHLTLSAKDTPDKAFREISRQLQSAGSGPFSLLTLDARLSAANALSGDLPDEARKLLNGVRADLKKNGFAQPPDVLVHRIVETLMALNDRDAEEVALSSDAPDALTPLVRYRLQKDRGGALDLIADRIKRGGFHIAAVSDLLPELVDDRDQADVLIGSLTRNFPAGKAGWIDCRLALDWAGMLIPSHNARASALLQAVLRESGGPAFSQRVKSDTRASFDFGKRQLSPVSSSESLILEAAGLLRAIDEAAFQKVEPQLGRDGEAIAAVGPMEALMAVESRKTSTVTTMNLPAASADSYRAGMHDIASLEPGKAAEAAGWIKEDDARVLVQLVLLEQGRISGNLRKETFDAALDSAAKLEDEAMRIRALSRFVRLSSADDRATAAAILASLEALSHYCNATRTDEPRTWECANDYSELAAAIDPVSMADYFKSPVLRSYLLVVKLNAHLGDQLDFTLKNLDGQQVRLQDFRGKVVLLDFWATWCGPCRRELPIVEKVHREMQEKGLMVLTVNDESAKVARAFVQDKKYTFAVLEDSKGEVFRRFHVRVIPTLVVFDRNGHMVSTSAGTRSEGALKSLLKKAGL